MARGQQGSERNVNLPRVSTRAGSHAGRGFRYQDAAVAWLAVRCWAGDLSYGGVTPEGLDDAELIGSGGNAFAQVKSRRDQLGVYACGDVAAYLRELWIRAKSASVAPEQVLLVLERSINGIELKPDATTPLAGLNNLLTLVAKDRLAGEWVAHTRIMVAPNPLESAVDLLVQKLNCTPLIAAVYFAAIADRVGNLSDGNGERSPGDFLSLSVSDLERDIERLASALSVDDLETALRRGLCEPVDFLTPLKDETFYLGTDVQPGHLAAGLLTERPESRTHVLNALERQRAALIAGPSGSGKSGLMWEAARESRHTVRWFRVRSSAEGDVVELLRLADTFRATAHMPIGFILDDIGRNRSGLWDALTEEVATCPNVLLLGTLREEDMFLVARRSLATEVREQPDIGLAERIWRELRDRGQTTWPGWHEPWQACKGLLLEYAHLLTQDRRLRDVLRDQVGRRVREKRRAELAVLRITSTAGKAGATVDLARLRHTLALSDDDLSDALRRLIDEHLIQQMNSGERLGSLHQIRASALADITHEIPPPLKIETVEQTVACIASEDLEGFIARTLAAEPELAQGILAGAVERIRADKCLTLLAAIVRGLDTGSIGDTITRWLVHVDHLGIPRTQATMAAMLSVASTEPFLEEKLQGHFEAARHLRDMVHHEYRRALIDRLEPQLSELLPDDPHWCGVAALLAALRGVPLPDAIEERLQESQPDLLTMPLDAAVELLETAGLITPTVAMCWVDRVGQAALLERLTHETPWISTAKFRNEPEGLAVCADVFHISDRLQGDIHGDVVALCRRLLALAPSADLAVSNAIAADGEPVGIGDIPIATKRIPRANLPAEALPARNRRWIAAAAQRVAPAGMSQYLADAKRLLDELVPLLEKLIDRIVRQKVRGRAMEQELDTLGTIYEASQNLTRPPDPETIDGKKSGVGVSDLQNVLHHCSADLLRGLINLPDRAAASYSIASDVLAQIDRASTEEPWTLIGDGPPPSMTRLRKLIEQARVIIGEAGFRSIRASQLAPGLVKSARSKKLFHMLSLSVRRQVDSRLKALSQALAAAAREAGYRARAVSRLVGDIGGPWPYAEALVVVALEQMTDWPTALAAVAEPLRKVSGPGRRLTIVPAVGEASLPDQAVSGVETLFPQPFGDVIWLEEIGLPAVDLPLTRLFDRFAAALLEASAIAAFGCGGEGRSPQEARALATSNEEIESARAELERAIPDVEKTEVMGYLDKVRDMGPNLAKDFWRHLHGRVASRDVAMLTAMKLMIVDVDSRVRIASDPAALP